MRQKSWQAFTTNWSPFCNWHPQTTHTKHLRWKMYSEVRYTNSFEKIFSPHERHLFFANILRKGRITGIYFAAATANNFRFTSRSLSGSIVFHRDNSTSATNYHCKRNNWRSARDKRYHWFSLYIGPRISADRIPRTIYCLPYRKSRVVVHPEECSWFTDGTPIINT